MKQNIEQMLKGDLQIQVSLKQKQGIIDIEVDRTQQREPNQPFIDVPLSKS